jgi:prepilin peptidase CpaA
VISDPIVVIAVAAGTGLAAAVDLRTRRVPNSLTLGIAAVGITLSAAGLDGVPLTAALEGMAVGLLLMLPGYALGKSGAGDVKLLAAAGTLLGPQSIAMAFLFAAIAGSALAVVVAIRRGRLRETLENTAVLVTTGGANVAEIENPSTNNRFAYAPAIAVGAIAAALWL